MQDQDKVKVPVQIPSLSDIGHNILDAFGLDVQSPKENTVQAVKETNVHNVKQSEKRKIIKETAKAEVRNGADKLEKTGTILQAAGYVAVPLTGGTSIALVPVGKAIESFGSLTNGMVDLSEGKVGKFAVNTISGAAFGKLGSKITSMENAGQLSKESSGIMQFVVDVYEKMSSAIINVVSDK